MDWTYLRGKYMSILSGMGFRPEIDSDGDIHFKYEGGNYYITDNCDDTFFFLLYPGIWTLDSKSEQLAGLMAANSATRRVKAAKVFVNSKMDRVAVTVECLVSDPADVRNVLMRSLRCAQEAVKVFKEEIRELMN
jgi:hypothetical protein